MRIRGYERPFAVQRTDIPVYLAAMGPLMTRLAGRDRRRLDQPRALLAALPRGAGPARPRRRHRGGRGATRADLDVVVSACCSVSADPAVARRGSAGLVGFYATVRTYADFFDFHGLADDQQAVIEAFRAGDGADYLADSGRPTEMVDALTMTGTRDDVIARIAAYDGLADSVKLSPPTHGLPAAEIARGARTRSSTLIAELTGASPR